MCIRQGGGNMYACLCLHMFSCKELKEPLKVIFFAERTERQGASLGRKFQFLLHVLIFPKFT